MRSRTPHLESQVLVAMHRSRHDSLLGWVPVAQLAARLSQQPAEEELDRAMRRLIRRGRLELWRPDHPPTGHNQCARLLHRERGTPDGP